VASIAAIIDYYQSFLNFPRLIMGHQRFEVLWRALIANQSRLEGGDLPPDSFEQHAMLAMELELFGMISNSTEPAHHVAVAKIFCSEIQTKD
jgi:hypothetical protein